jgi:hypothetical protein
MPIWQRSRPVRALALVVFAAAILVAAPSIDVSGGSPAPIPLGGEFVIHTDACDPSYYYLSRSGPAASGTSAGRFAVAWRAYCAPTVYGYGSDYVFASRFGADGRGEGPTLQVAKGGSLGHYGGITVSVGGVTPGPAGGFAIATSIQRRYLSEFDSWIRATIYDGAGTLLETFVANELPWGENSISAVIASDGAGSLALGWYRNESHDEAEGVRARLATALGVPLTSEFRVSAVRPGGQWRPDVAMAPDGRFVVVWQSEDQDGSGLGIFGQLYDASGVPVGDEIPINAWTLGDQRSPAVAMGPDGRFVVAWTSDDGISSDLVMRRFEADGSPAGDELLIWNPVLVDTAGPDVTRSADGFAVTWSAAGGDDNDAWMRGFDWSGTPTGAPIRLSDLLGNQTQPGIAAVDEARFVVVWRHLEGPGEIRGRFVGTPIRGGLISYWPFDDGAGSPTVADVVGTNGGELLGMNPVAAWQEGRFGGALGFAGDPEHVDFGASESLDAAKGMALSLWLRPDDVEGSQVAFAKDVAAGSNSFMLFTANDWNPLHPDAPRAMVTLEDGGGGELLRGNAPGPLAAGEWHHVVMSYDSSDGVLRLWVDGAQVASATDPEGRPIQVTASELVAGAKTSLEQYYRGRIDDAALWNRPLSEVEVGLLWDAGRGRSVGELLGLVMMDGFESGDTAGWSRGS